MSERREGQREQKSGHLRERWCSACPKLEAAEGLAEAAGAIIACLGDGGYLPTAGKPKTDALRAALAKWEGRE